MPHDHRGHVVIAVGAVMTALATATVLARLYTRYFIIHHIGVDDWMAILSLVRACPLPCFPPRGPADEASQLFAHAMNISQSVNATGLLGRRFYDIQNFPVEFPEFLKVRSLPLASQSADGGRRTDTTPANDSSFG